jgi:hypothetical protein
MTELLEDIERFMNSEIMEADRDCFRRRSKLMDWLERIKKEKQASGLL